MREKEGDSKIYRLMLPSYFLPKVVIGENNFISLANQNAQRETDDSAERENDSHTYLIDPI